jgi:hypothetical protein
MDRVTQALGRGVEEPVLSVAEGTSALLNLPVLLGAFRPPMSDHRVCCDTHLNGQGYFFAVSTPGKGGPGG